MGVAGGTCKFVSKKIRKVRWRPRSDTAQAVTNVFATGSWDEEVNEVCLWKCEDGEGAVPVAVAAIEHQGDVTGLNWVTPHLLASSSSQGGLKLLKFDEADRSLEASQAWPGLHSHAVSGGGGGATCLAAHGETLVTAGQDGKINLINIKQRNPLKVYEKGDSCSITDITFSRSSEIVAANMRGQLRVFDTRSNLLEASTTLMLSNEQVAVTSLARHPTQGHILLSGGEDGFLAVWDLRQARYPVTLLSAHQAPISEVKFHPDLPDHIFTCSQGGELWHWNGASIKTAAAAAHLTGTANTASLDNLNSTSPWLSSEAVKHKVETNSLVSRHPLPINSVDILGHTVVFGGDNEAVYVINNILI